jgi:hypothetical protein
MDLVKILRELNAERERLDKAIAALEAVRKLRSKQLASELPGNKTVSNRISEAGRRRISQAMKRRWAETRKKKTTA